MSEPLDWRAFLRQYGYYAVDFEFVNSGTPSLPELQRWMVSDSPSHTGWPPFWWPTRQEIAPRVIDDATYECLHDGSGRVGHIERWRASTRGSFTILRAHDSDYEEPGRFLELTLPTWRIAEILLYAERMAKRFESPEVDFRIRYTGLAGRTLSNRAAQNRMLFHEYTTGAPKYERRVSLQTEDMDVGVVEITDHLLRPLYHLFQFELPAPFFEQEISRLRSGRF